MVNVCDFTPGVLPGSLVAINYDNISVNGKGSKRKTYLFFFNRPPFCGILEIKCALVMQISVDTSLWVKKGNSRLAKMHFSQPGIFCDDTHRSCFMRVRFSLLLV